MRIPFESNSHCVETIDMVNLASLIAHAHRKGAIVLSCLESDAS